MGKTAPPILFADKYSCPRPSRWYGGTMAGYKRPPSRSEVRQMRRTRMRLVLWGTAVLLFTLVGIAGLICLIYAKGPH